MVLLALACTSEPAPCAEGYGRAGSGACVDLAGGDPRDSPAPDTATAPDTSTPDTGEAVVGPTFELGDPLATTFVEELEEHHFEAVSALGLSAERAVVAGQGGWILVDTTTGELLQVQADLRTYDLAWDPVSERVYAGTRFDDVYCLDTSDPDELSTGPCTIPAPAFAYDDVAAYGDVVVLAAQDQGARLYDGLAGRHLGTAEATPAWSVGVHGDRLVVATDEELVLYDVSATDGPQELSRVGLDGRGADLGFDGETAVVAMGADGVGVYRVTDDELIERGGWDTVGSAVAIALDGDFAYSASWNAIEAGWVGEGDPVGIGHEPAQQLALGVGAKDGAVVVADWFRLDVIAHDQALAGPELTVPETLYFSEEGDNALTIQNGGAMDLEVSLQMAAGGETFVLGTDEVTVPPGGAEVVVVTVEQRGPGTELLLTTNDPDEQDASVTFSWGGGSVGQEVDDFELPGFTLEDPSTALYTLSEHRGKAVYLVFWAEY